MSRLTDLIAKTKTTESKLGADLEREFRALSSRLSFGLNFERHNPEAVELPKRPIRRADKVRILPPRGTTSKGDQQLWQVRSIQKAKKTAELALLHSEKEEAQTVALDDLVVVAEFGDTIYPGLISTGKVFRGKNKPWHTVINGENYHALKALTWTHRGKVDAIYIDPPYNSGARDWKYNNDYVESEDLYRHSKWLAMMERRLLIAKELLNPRDSVLIATIDEKEYLRLGLLIEQIFPEAIVEMVTTVVNPRGRHRPRRFARTDEYIFFVLLGSAAVGQEEDTDFSGGSKVPWRTLRRSDAASARGTSKGGPAQFYPIYVNDKGCIEHIGDALPHDMPRELAPKRPGCTAVFPIRDNGLEMNWGLVAPALRKIHERGFVRVGRNTNNKPQQWEISYLTSGKIADIDSGRAKITGESPDGSVVAEYVDDKLKIPSSNWVRPSHNAETGGTLTLGSLLPERKFPFPKSLYAVEDALRFFVKEKPEAIILDFFAGSGTTAHAVMRLNKQDNGKRQCISVTNNEVSANEQKGLREQGLRPGDPEWEKLGICDYITKPRVEAAITGKTPEGKPIDGSYQFGNTIEKQKPRNFKQIGFTEPDMFDSMTKKKQLVALIDDLPQSLVKGPCPFIVSEEHTSSVLFDPQYSDDWLNALDEQDHITDFYIVTPLNKTFNMLKKQVSSLLGPAIVIEQEELPMEDGFEENAEFFTLTYETPLAVSYQTAFTRIDSLLWLRAGSIGNRIEKLPSKGWDVVEAYGLLVELDKATDFLKAVRETKSLRIAYIVTDDERRFQALTRRLPEGVEPIRLYESYLTNFAFANGDEI